MGLATMLGAAERPPSGSADVAWTVFEAFSASCVECHGGHARPKGGFGYVLDLARLGSDGQYVVPGDPESSDLYLMLVDEDPDFRMPPEDADVPALSAAQIAAVHRWISDGATLHRRIGPGLAVADDEELPAEAGEVESPSGMDEPSAAGLGAVLRRFFGHLHPLMVHLPIGLLLAACGAATLHRVIPRPWLDGAVPWCLWCGALGSLVSIATGWIDAGVQGYSDPTVFVHRWTGVATAALATVAAVLDTGGRWRGKSTLCHLAFVLLLVAAILVSIAGHTGGSLVHGEDYLW